ncbi:MAG: exosortase U [Aureliella sp.]
MPERLLGAERIAFHREQRSPDSFLGEYSRIWRYRTERSEFYLSADFPFRGFHPLWVCYTNAGNTLDGDPQKMQLPNAPASAEPNVGFAKFKDDLGSTSYLWFMLFDASGKPVHMRQYEETVGNQLMDRFARGNAVELGAEPITYQFQLYLQSGRDLPQAQLDEYLKMFAEALPHAVERVRQLNAAAGLNAETQR